MKATISGIYNTNADDKPLITKNGDPYVRLRLSLDNGESHYENIFCSRKAFWVIENIYKSAKRTPIPIEAMIKTDEEGNDSIDWSGFSNELYEAEVDVVIGPQKTNPQYNEVKLWRHEEEKKAATVESKVSADLDEDVPF